MIQFKTPRIADEWLLLGLKNDRLKGVLLALEQFVEIEFRKDVVITCLLRTQQENSACGGIIMSPHLSWQAADLRSSIYTEAEINRMVTFLNQFTYRDGKKTALYHRVVGGAPHFHVQCRSDESR